MQIKTIKMENANIPMLTAHDQYLPTGTVNTLGMDTELLVKANDKYLWPHEEGFPQERVLLKEPGSPLFDWHGDGYAFELCVVPVYCLEHMMERVGKALLHMKSTMEAKHKAAITLDTSAVYKVPAKVRNAAPDVVKRLGCAPSFNVYGDAGKPGTLGESIRTTGCHLHISAGKVLDKEDVALNLVKWSDVIVGNVWNFVSPEDSSKESLRRKSYGRAGECRIRTYPATKETYPVKGVEYRVLPGTVLRNPVYMTLVFNLYRTALRFSMQYMAPPEEITELSKEAINSGNKELSMEVIKWLPFREPARKLLDYIHTNPQPALTPQEWYNVSQMHQGKGHRYLAMTKEFYEEFYDEG